MCAPLKASRFEKMESFSAGGPGWQVFKSIWSSQAGEGFSTLAGQNMGEWEWASVLMWMRYLIKLRLLQILRTQIFNSLLKTRN